MKKLIDLGLPITEEEYRNDGCIHYSTLSRFTRGGGYNGLHKLFDKIESSSLILGSCTDILMTDGEEEFWNNYYVDDIPDLDPKVANTVKFLFDSYSNTCSSIDEISDSALVAAVKSFGIFNNCSRTETIVKKIVEVGEKYYRALYLAEGKTIISNKVYNEALGMCNALRTSPATAFFFESNNPFNSNIERVYQPKFKATFDGIDYSCMCDGLVAIHDKKKIIAFDLKTSHNKEFNFFHSFLEFNYHYQARQYYRIVRDAMNKDDYFKDFELTNWYFIVVNKDSKNPLVWEYTDTKKTGTLYYGKNNQIEIKDPFDVAKELKYYLDNECIVPQGIYLDKPNNLIEWLNKL